MNVTLFRWGMLGLCLLGLTGCSPKFTPQEINQMATGNTPQPQNTDFQQALRTFGRVVNSGGETPALFMVAPIINKTGKKEAPDDITDLVISSVNYVAGPFIAQAPYPSGNSAPEQVVRIVIDQPAASQPSQPAPIQQPQAITPTFLITGAITEFDQDISVKQSGLDLNFFISPEIEDEVVDIDLNAEFDKAETVSRIAIDFHLIDANTGNYVSHANCSNSILIYDIEKNRQWRFIIYGSGLTRWGKIHIKQGVHEAVRKLVDYSMLELFGTHYGLPYWRALGHELPQKGYEVLTEWRQRFNRNQPDYQVLMIQRLLLKYELDVVYVNGALRRQAELLNEQADFGDVTEAFTLKFLYSYDPENTRLIGVFEGKAQPYPDILPDIYMALVQHVPML